MAVIEGKAAVSNWQIGPAISNWQLAVSQAKTPAISSWQLAVSRTNPNPKIKTNTPGVHFSVPPCLRGGCLNGGRQ